MPSPPAAMWPESSRFAAFCERHFAWLMAAVLCLAAANLGVRLGAEIVTEWDEAMYALSAHEMVSSGQWAATTIHGELDYYNTKPPLNIWLIALSFKAFGTSLVTLRLVSTISAWLTVGLLVFWTRRVFGAAIGVIAGVVLSTNFGFIHVHAGRSGNTDALLTLLILLTVILLWSARHAAWRLVFIPVLLAATFLLKGMSLLLPLAIVVIVEAWRWPGDRRRWIHLCFGTPLFVLPVSLWAFFRWQVDRWEFLRRVLVDDFFGHTLDVLDGHGKGFLFFLNELQKQEYGWLLVATVAWVLWRSGRPQWRMPRLANLNDHRVLLGAWALVTLLVPTLMRTKLPWYLNPFYPAFALVIGWILAGAIAETRTRTRAAAVAAVFSLVFVAAEARLFWYSYKYRGLPASSQGLLLSEAPALREHLVFAREWSNAERFVVRALIGSDVREAMDVAQFLDCSEIGDYLLWRDPVSDPAMTLVRMERGLGLYLRLPLTGIATPTR